VITNILKTFQAMIPYAQLSMRVVAHHIEVTRSSEDGGMRFSARHLLNKNVEAACFRKSETFNVLIPLLNFLMIKAKLSIRIITPDEHFGEIEVYRALPGRIPSRE
jgi:hypothetical protein